MTNEPVYYAHPSAGFFLEACRIEPHGACHRLVPRTGTSEPPLTETVIAATEEIWQRRWTNHLSRLADQFAAARQRANRWRRPRFQWLRLAERPNPTANALCLAYAKSLNHWGVQMQRAGHEPEAIEWFRRAVAVNPSNLAAHLNLMYATRRQQGDPTRLSAVAAREEFAELFGQHENLWDVLNFHGPVDEPTFLLHTGRIMLANGQPRQAIADFARCAELAPDWLAPKLWQAQSFYFTRDYERALKLTDEVVATDAQMQGAGLAQLLICRAASMWGLGRTNDATAYLERVVAEHGADDRVLNAAATLCEAIGQFQRELDMRETLTQRDPNNPERLTRQGVAEVRLSRFDAAINTLTKALTLSPADKEARQARAVAWLGAGQFESARRDYTDLLKQPGGAPAGLFGLGSVAWREQDTNAVIQYYQQFLSNNVVRTPQAMLATQRLRQLTDEP
jgi:tetratricopeptide (TPR) repeat protein